MRDVVLQASLLGLPCRVSLGLPRHVCVFVMFVCLSGERFIKGLVSWRRLCCFVIHACTLPHFKLARWTKLD